ncbi:MAG TPA: M6 family metalloprotease domain-containing protein [Thermoanaerobaculia bacterium]|nr:M6 family metalloprotease domain-containing protein [Thermoanaerobaculia bacterium]
MNEKRVLIRHHTTETRCLVAPRPDVLASLRSDIETVRDGAIAAASAATSFLTLRRPQAFGFDDGTILPPDEFELGTAADVMRSAAATRAPLRGNLNVVAVLVDFPDAPMTRPSADFQDLFFGQGTNSVADYFAEVSGNLIGITGSVVGPFTLPLTLAQYANGQSGTGQSAPNAQTMARDAANAALAHIDQSLDNDDNGFVDAFVVIHAGRGAEETKSNGDIWSHKWVLANGAVTAADGTRIFAYLTVPEDSRLGVCVHELGHLLFGWPDLYDTDYTSEGVGNWCLMAGGSWNGPGVGAAPGDVPAHPSAWCKATQKWVNVVAQSQNAQVTISDVHNSRTVYRLWKDGAFASEYFLVENRQRNGFDRDLPGDGLLIWHIDDSIASNTNENHYKVALVQADGSRDLERAADRGDTSDPYPGTANNTAFDGQSNPSSDSYSAIPTSVAVTSIPGSAADMTVQLTVTAATRRRRRRAVRSTDPEPVLPIRDAAPAADYVVPDPKPPEITA